MKKSLKQILLPELDLQNSMKVLVNYLKKIISTIIIEEQFNLHYALGNLFRVETASKKI